MDSDWDADDLRKHNRNYYPMVDRRIPRETMWEHVFREMFSILDGILVATVIPTLDGLHSPPPLASLLSLSACLAPY